MFKTFLILLIVGLTVTSCRKKDIPALNYAVEMRDFITKLSFHARLANPDFIVIPQNGAKLMASDIENASSADLDYLAAIDGQGQEDLFFGYDDDNQPSDLAFQNEIIPFLDLGKDNGKTILVTDYCSSSGNVSQAISKNADRGYVSFVATDRELNQIPNLVVNNENDNSIEKLSDVQNFLYLINPNTYKTSSEFVAAIDPYNFDALIIDFFDYDGNALKAADIAKLQTKPNGARRLVLAYMSIGEAEDYRFYWKNEWKKRKNEPDWLYEENKKWKGNYKVFYWMTDWQNIIFGSPTGYLDQIVDTGFDGVYLDIVDAYEFYDDEKNK